MDPDQNGSGSDRLAGSGHHHGDSAAVCGRPVGGLPGDRVRYLADLPASIAGVAVQANSLTPIYPSISLPVAVIVRDAVGRIQQVIDMRPSYLSSVPPFASSSLEQGQYVIVAAENIGDPTKRVNFQNNYYVPRTYALSPQIPQDANLPCGGFFLGAGSVV